MAIGATRPPSTQNLRDDYWSGDPAFLQLPKDATDAQRDEHARKWRVARETGNYAELLVAGASPTKFVLRPLPGEVYRRLMDMVSGKRIGLMEAGQLAFRYALVDVYNLADLKVKYVESDYGKIATAEVPNFLDEHAFGCVDELAAEVLSRAMGLSGKS